MHEEIKARERYCGPMDIVGGVVLASMPFVAVGSGYLCYHALTAFPLIVQSISWDTMIAISIGAGIAMFFIVGGLANHFIGSEGI